MLVYMCQCVNVSCVMCRVTYDYDSIQRWLEGVCVVKDVIDG